MTEFEAKFEAELQKQISEIEKPNLLVVGGTGVGKSSLINRVFGSETTKVGAGQPVTKGLQRCYDSNIPIVFFDAEGYEISEDGNVTNNNFQRNVAPKIEEMMKGEIYEQIHLVWYCISLANHRVTEFDFDNMKYFFQKNMKLAVVLTQCDTDDEEGSESQIFKNIINQHYPQVPCFETCATVSDIALDLEKLIAWSSEALPTENIRKSFIQAQKASISEKKKKAYTIAGTFTGTTAATAAFNPIPVSDALVIAPQQLTMCVEIANIFWMGTGLSSSIKSLLETQIISLLGKQAVTSLLKIIPGLGHAVNAAVTGTITFGLGAALIESHANALKEFLDSGKIPDWHEIFNSSSFIDAIKTAMKNKPDNR